MKNLLIFSAVVLFMLTVFSWFEPDPEQVNSADPNEQALRDAGYYDDMEAVAPPSAGAGAPGNTAAFQRRTGEPRSIPQSATLPASVLHDICALRRTQGESDLIRLFGEPDLRQELKDPVTSMLTWHTDAYSVWATMNENGTLDLAVAGSKMKTIKGDTRQPPVDLSSLSTGQSSLSDVENLLGPGVLTKVSWNKGLDIQPQQALQRGLQERDTRDHCDSLHTWLVPGHARPLTVAFDESNRTTTNAIAMFN